MAGESAQKQASDVVSQTKETANAAMQQASGKAANYTDQAKATLNQTTQQASDLAHKASQQATDLAHKTYDTVQHLPERVGELRGATEQYVSETLHKTEAVAETMPPYQKLKQKPKLKRLETLRWAGSLLLALTVYIEFIPYRVARWFTPKALDKYVTQAEQLLYRTVEPIINWWGELAYHFLKVSDDVVDQLIHYAFNFTKENAEHFEVAKEAYLQLVEEWADKLQHNGLFGARAA